MAEPMCGSMLPDGPVNVRLHGGKLPSSSSFSSSSSSSSLSLPLRGSPGRLRTGCPPQLPPGARLQREQSLVR
eukprot:scaffold52782_cov38-Phaeocystis_antarctica.AAC.2